MDLLLLMEVLRAFVFMILFFELASQTFHVQRQICLGQFELAMLRLQWHDEETNTQTNKQYKQYKKRS